MTRQSNWKSVKTIMGVAILALALNAQENTATIAGQVTDPSGALMPNVVVTARNVLTGIKRTAISNETANYSIPLLSIGTYEVTAEREGFKTFRQTGVVLQVGEHARVDFSLLVGSASESVQVTAEVPLTQTDTSSVGSVIDNRKVVELPLNGRQFYSLALLVPGVVPPAQGSILSFRGGFNVAGASELNNNFTLNGLVNNDQLLSAPAFRPSVDAIQEFKILTGVFPAEYGRNSGSQVIVTTKTGGNAFHGSAFEFLRNQVFDAKNYFTPGNTATPSFKQNQFGGTLGGPIIHNKTFFFASYEGTRATQQITALANVPTPEMLQGDFRQLLTLARPVRVLNPFTKQDFTAPNVVDANLINPIGKALAAFYPSPTSPTPAGLAPANNYTFNQPRKDTLDLGTIRIDHTFSAKDTINGSYNDFEETTIEQSNTVCGSRVIPGFDCTVGLTSRLMGLTETHIFSPSVINEFRFGYSQFLNPREGNDQTIKFLEQFNIQGTRSDGPPRAGVPQVSVQGFATIGEPTNFPQVRIDHTYQAADSLTMNRGKHSLKFGVDFQKFQSNGTRVGNGRGSFSFAAQTTAPTSGYALADLLLGLPTSTSRSPTSPRFYDRTAIYSAFVQDDWKISPRLTLNIGFRYEYNMPVYDKPNLLSNFNPAKGTIEIQGENGLPQGIWDSNYKDFQPRFGFSWQPFKNSKTVVRGGYGIFYNAPALNNVSSGPQQSNAPFVSAETFNSSLSSPVTLNNPFPTANTVTGGTLTLSAINRYQPDAQIQQWSLNIQRELSRQMVVEIGYQGSKGTHLPLLYNINSPPPGLGTVAQKQALRPYPQFGNITFLDAVGNSSFNGLLTRLERRYSNGLSFLLSYTYGKSIDNTPGTPYNVTPSRSSAMNRENLAAERGLSGFDIRQRLVFSPVWELPFGKGKAFLSGKGPASYLAGGWEISGILSLQSGRPFTALVSRDNSNVLASVDRPDIIGNGNAGPKTVQQWINVSAFQIAPAGTFGNGGRNNLIAPAFKNLDLVLGRRFVITERWSVQFRAEAFNLANHPNFDAPAQTVDNPSFGSIPSAQSPRQIQFGLKIRF
jgi:hypothetical protein